MAISQSAGRVVKPLVFAGCLLPLTLLVWRAATGGLGANPISEAIHETGDWTLRFVLLTLAVTPFSRLSGRREAAGLRRPLGLFAFFYGCLHFLTYLALDQFFDLRAVVADIVKRPYITVGLIGLAAMAPLAVTSTSRAFGRLGERRWKRLHELIYLTAVAGVVHYWWSVKADLFWPQAYAALLALLLGYRAAVAVRARRPASF